MKTHLLSALAALGLSVAITSCVPFDPAYDGGYGGGYSTTTNYYSSPGYNYNDDDFYYYDGGAYPSYYGRPYGTYSVGYSYYRGRNVCPICHHSPCNGHSGRSSSWRSSNYHRDYDHDHDDHRSYSSYSHSSGSSHSNGSSHGSSSNKSSGQTLYRHLSADNNPGAPQGLHTKEWYTSHGYGASRLKPANDDNHKSSSSSHHSSSKKDDDNHHKKH